MRENRDCPIRILHVIGIMNRGGAETMIMNLYRNIDRTKVQFDFVENEGETAAFDEEILSLGGKIYRCPRYLGKNHLAYVKWWHSFFSSHKGEYPVVHGHIGSTAAIYLFIAKKYGCYAIAHSHGAGKGSMMYRLLSYPTRYIADHFFACSGDAGISRYGSRVGNDANRCQVLNNAIDVEKFSFHPQQRKLIRDSLGIAEDTLVVGHVGRFVEVKNHRFLLEIFEEIQKQNQNTVLLLVGDGELRPMIEQTVVKRGLQQSVIFAGLQSDVARYYQAMDVFAFPSISEGLGIVAIEAQTAGLPCCVSSGVPLDAGITDLVQYRSLEESPEQWACWILNRSVYQRQDKKEDVGCAGYDIAKTSRWLEEFYLGL